MASAKRQRVDKILAHMGYGTRKEIKRLIKEERVQVNGLPVKDPGLNIIPGEDRLAVDGEYVEYRPYIYIMLNKPQGVVSATEDRTAEVVVDLLPLRYRARRPFPVGRLDKDTEGLLLLTNDGCLAHNLLSPKKHVPKRYYAVVKGTVTAGDVEAFHRGLLLDDGYCTLPGELKILCVGQQSEVEVTIYEGKYHQIKRMFAAVGKEVVYLKRIAMGPLVLDETLNPGEYRELTDREVTALRELTGQ
ncbi:pseudouridine synthase [Neomoorella humiferrea]|uniref:pseudouridine synthase n=1 Tax=Neomoorella humiferrea TaxID=676965 RepID=UPI003D8FB0BD